MSINIGPATTDDMRPRITVIGVGGAGGNAIANMIQSQIEGVEFIVTNTDAQALSNAVAEKRIQLGPDITGGLGAGARPEVGKAAAEETVAEIEDALEGVNMCFIAAGMGGGTGTGAAPVIAEAARRKGVLTVGVVTKPFLFEGTRRMRAAEAGIVELQKHVDTLIVIPNQNLFLIAKADTTFKEAFILADEVLQQGVRSITDLMVMPGLINLDFADVRSVMSEMGKAMMGTGEGEGENRALDAAERAIANPLLDGVSMQGAKGVIISIIGGEDMKLLEVDEAANHIRELVDEDANIIWGSAFNPDLDGKIRVSVVATGIEANLDSAPMDRSSLSLGSARAPKRPVLELPAEDEFADEITPETAESFANLGSFPADEEEEFEDDGDVDGIVDPLAGIRNYEDDEDDDLLSEPAKPGSIADFDGHRAFGSASASDSVSDEEPLDLLAEAEESVASNTTQSQDELLLEAGQGIESAKLEGANRDSDASRRSGLVAGGTSSAGSTLFERMANLSRGSSSSRDEDEDEDDDSGDSSSLSIPRFLGRQNNQ
ncbi:cell division protein FtsZ [Allopontixanthobacter sp.]|uniref:cell division protein FtsZ n=1 Tax=Allopontixanthobacter sp. TaxID=2906452 RepID=UPI002ABC8D65|nr:cell division protein FtsZ [Allopontixanthobacter sp.]MDZ4307376.1 cell division protein FtsZ [Allopontixanthobacter sp.]